MTWTTDTLVSRIRRRANLPDASAGGPSDSELLDAAYEEILAVFQPILRTTQESYATAITDIAIVSGTPRYRIPRDSLGGTVRDVRLVDADGVEISVLKALPTDAPAYGSSGSLSAYTIEGDHIRLLPSPSSSMSGYSLRVWYYRRPSKLVPVSSCYTIASTTSTTIVLSSDPSYGSTTEFDVVFASPQFDLVLDGATASWSTVTATFSGGEDLSELSAGDYLCAHMETCVPRLPELMHGALASSVAAQILLEEGDQRGAAAEIAQRDRLIGASRSALDPRADASPNHIINRSSVLRRGGAFGRRYST